MGFMAPQQKKEEVSPNVKMKMNEEEGPGEEDETRELVRSLNASEASGQQIQT